MGAELFHAGGWTDGGTNRQTDRQTDRQNEVNSHFSQFFKRAKMIKYFRFFLFLTLSQKFSILFPVQEEHSFASKCTEVLTHVSLLCLCLVICRLFWSGSNLLANMRGNSTVLDDNLKLLKAQQITVMSFPFHDSRTGLQQYHQSTVSSIWRSRCTQYPT